MYNKTAEHEIAHLTYNITKADRSYGDLIHHVEAAADKNELYILLEEVTDFDTQCDMETAAVLMRIVEVEMSIHHISKGLELDPETYAPNVHAYSKDPRHLEREIRRRIAAA